MQIVFKCAGAVVFHACVLVQILIIVYCEIQSHSFGHVATISSSLVKFLPQSE